MRNNILFVTYREEDLRSGPILCNRSCKNYEQGDDCSVLLICRRNLMERFADVMMSVTFAEVGEYKTAKNVYGRRREKRFRRQGNRFPCRKMAGDRRRVKVQVYGNRLSSCS